MSDDAHPEPAVNEPTVNEPTVDDATLEEAKESAAGLDDRYRPGARPTVSLPGTNGTVAGTAFADMVDDNGELRDSDEENTSSDDD